VEWNREHVGAFARRPLDDRRTRVHLGDAVALIYSSSALYDAILLDIDNGPSAMVHAENQRLYGDRGIAACRAALRPGGVAT
jgi:spermidine synthase